jgi:hypothetical protein
VRNSPRLFPGGSDNRKDVRDDDWLVPSFGVVDGESQGSAGDWNR